VCAAYAAYVASVASVVVIVLQDVSRDAIVETGDCLCRRVPVI
jgi:hypothetical protein